MTDHIEKGRSSRSLAAVMLSVLIAAMMIAIPVITSVGSDAAFAEDKAGDVVKMTDPTDAEIEKYNARSELMQIKYASDIFLMIFNEDNYDTPVLTTASYSTVTADTMKVESNDTSYTIVDEVSATEVKLEFTADKDGTLIEEWEFDDDYKAAINAIKSYLGDSISVGDKVTITGKVSFRSAYIVVYGWTAVDDSRFVIKEGAISIYRVYNVDVDIGLQKSGETTSKSIQFNSDKRYMMAMDVNYDYHGTPYSELKSTSPCTITYGNQRFDFETGGSHYTVDGTKYYVKYGADTPSPEETTAELASASDMATSASEFKSIINSIPDSSGNVTVDKTYDAAESEFNSIVFDVVGEEIIDLLIVVAIVAAIILVAAVIAVIIIVVIVGKHK